MLCVVHPWRSRVFLPIHWTSYIGLPIAHAINAIVQILMVQMMEKHVERDENEPSKLSRPVKGMSVARLIEDSTLQVLAERQKAQEQSQKAEVFEGAPLCNCI